MIATRPAVQRNCKPYWTRTRHRQTSVRATANRRHRHALNQATRTFVLDPDLFDDEPFSAPTLSDYELD